MERRESSAEIGIDSENGGSAPEIWIGIADEFNNDLLSAAYDSILNDAERARHERYRHERDRRLHLIARLMIRTILSRHQPEIKPHEWEFQPGPHGKPEIVGPVNHSGKLHFNITHTEGVVALAVSRSGPVGVDVERIDRPIDHLGLARRYFAEIEAIALDNCALEERGELFYRIWTLKEAYVKAVGKGLAHALDSFWFEPIEAAELNPRLQLIDETGTKSSADWAARVMRVGAGGAWIVSVVARTPVSSLIKHDWPARHFSSLFR